MKQETIRIGPTALWIIFGPVLGCMWLAAVNYSNNLVYAILYLVASLSFISLFHTWRNLAAVQVEHIRIHPAFAGQEVRVDIFLRNRSKRVIYGLFFSRLGDESRSWRSQTTLRTPGGVGVRIDVGDSCVATAVFPSERRGMYKFEALQVRSAYPFGLFWARARLPINAEYYIYPQVRGSEQFPTLVPGGDDGSPTSNQPGDDFSGVRAYVPGESLRHVDWKAFARGRPLSIKQFTGGSGQELWLDAAEMGRMPLEKKLSQLALWIVAAEKAEIPYALKLGRTVLPLGRGDDHARKALEALAVAGAGTA